MLKKSVVTFFALILSFSAGTAFSATMSTSFSNIGNFSSTSSLGNNHQIKSLTKLPAGLKDLTKRSTSFMDNTNKFGPMALRPAKSSKTTVGPAAVLSRRPPMTPGINNTALLKRTSSRMNPHRDLRVFSSRNSLSSFRSMGLPVPNQPRKPFPILNKPGENADIMK